jgi:uncharacterized membrane protein
MTSVESPTETLRPSREHYAKTVRRELRVLIPLMVIAVASLIVLLLFANNSEGDRLKYWFLGAVMIVGIPSYVVNYFLVKRNVRIELGATSLVATNAAGRKRTVSYSDVGAVVQPLIQYSARTLPMLFVLDHSGRRVFTMYGYVWSPEPMGAVASATGVEPTTLPAAISYRELRKLYPNAISWARANPVALGIMIVAGVFLVRVAATIVYLADLGWSSN